MSLTIEQIEEQIANLQQTLEQLKNPKLEVARHFSGQYFAPYQGRLYRRMESEGIPIWETYLDIKKEWVLAETKESKNLEKTYQQDCIVAEEIIEE
jgi:hypothetical protein